MRILRVCFALPAALGLLTPGLLLAQGGAYTVQGQLNAKTPPTKAYLLTPSKKGFELDSATVQRGRFTFKGTVVEPTWAWLLLGRPGRSYTLQRPAPGPTLKLFLEPGTVRVLSPDSLPHAMLSGTPLNLDQQRLAQLTLATAARLQAVETEWRAASPEKRQDKAYAASYAKSYEAADQANYLAVKQFIKTTPNSLVSLYALQDNVGASLDPAEAGPLFEGLSPVVRQSPRGQRFAARLENARKLAVGALAPDFTQNDPSGKPVKLSDFRGKYVLVDFWASWCGPCRQENPNVVANYNQYKNKGFRVLGVSLDQPNGHDAWLKAIDTDGLAWTQVSDLKGWKNEAAQLYDIQAIPQNLLIGPEGRIVAKNIRGEELSQKLAAVLRATAP